MASDEPSTQLLAELGDSVKRSLSLRRPVLHHLNADTSWLLQIPRPQNAVKYGARLYYNILIDPWFTGGQSDVASWFSQQFHAEPSAVKSIAELEELIRDIEILAAQVRHGKSFRKSDVEVEKELLETKSLIDAVVISHEFTDHCHKDTLLELGQDVPIFAAQEAAGLITRWKHFRTVVTVSSFGQEDDLDWRGTSLPPLPEWIGISRLLSTDDVLNYHSAIMITFNNRHGNAQSKLASTNGHLKNGTRKRHRSVIEPNEDDESAEAVIYTSHGINSGDVNLVPKAQPPITTLAFLHGLHNVRIGTMSGKTALQLNLGSHNGLKAQRILKSDYWIGTHDEIKKGGGLVAWFLQRQVMTLKDALEQERKARRNGEGKRISGELGATLEALDETNWIDLKNGESRILY